MRIRIITLSVICVFAAFFIFIFCVTDKQPEKNRPSQKLPQESDLSALLDLSVAFILEEYGQKQVFETSLCNEDISDCEKKTPFSLFMSTAILNIIQKMERSDFDGIIKREVSRTLKCQNKHLLWDFYCVRKYDDKHYYPDLDSTSLASWFLSSLNTEHHLEKIREQIRETQFHNGALLTFLRDFQPKPHAMNQDPVANANALVLLSEEIPSVCEFINGNFDKSIYYTDDVVVFYMLSTAYSRGSKCIKPALDKLLERIKSSDLLNKYKMPMHLAMFVTALINSGYTEDKVLEATIKSLFENAKELPFREPFFRTGLNQKNDFYYSPAFSAAIYAEALSNIKSYRAAKPDQK